MQTPEQIKKIKRNAIQFIQNDQKPDETQFMECLGLVISLCIQIETQQKDLDFLQALEACGVDNWDGYGFAREMLENQ